MILNPKAYQRNPISTHELNKESQPLDANSEPFQITEAKTKALLKDPRLGSRDADWISIKCFPD